jgi:hypothetical protein
MTIVLSIVGIGLIILAAQDLFHTIFHPAARGNVSDWIAHIVWRVCHAGNRIKIAGPIAFVMTVLFWGVSLVVGFALLYLPNLPSRFVFATGLNPEAHASFPGAVNLSLGTLITLSTGIYGNTMFLEFVMGIESLVGFGLLTASISWILSIYPVIEHRRSLAHQATLLHYSDAHGTRTLDRIPDTEMVQILLGLTSQVTTHRNELMQFPIAYYFAGQDLVTTLPGILPYLADIADENSRRTGAAALAGASLGGAIDDYLKFACPTFLHQAFTTREQALYALAADHMREVVRSPRQRREE